MAWRGVQRRVHTAQRAGRAHLNGRRIGNDKLGKRAYKCGSLDVFNVFETTCRRLLADVSIISALVCSFLDNIL